VHGEWFSLLRQCASDFNEKFDEGSIASIGYFIRSCQRWLAEQCRFEFVLFVLFEAEQNKAIVRKLPNRTEQGVCSVRVCSGCSGKCIGQTE